MSVSVSVECVSVSGRHMPRVIFVVYLQSFKLPVFKSNFRVNSVTITTHHIYFNEFQVRRHVECRKDHQLQRLSAVLDVVRVLIMKIVELIGLVAQVLADRNVS